MRTLKARERVILSEERKGMPLGNLTSQFFGNVYLNELDYFVKHKLEDISSFQAGASPQWF